MTNNYRILFVFALLVAGGIGFSMFRAPAYAEGKRYAVTLSNERVYFGKLTRITDESIDLSEIYTVMGQTNDKKTLTLVRVGEGTYSIDGNMHINRQNVLFFSPIGDNSKINEAITRHQTESVASPTPSPVESTSPSPQP